MTDKADFLPDELVQLVKNRQQLPDDLLISLYRELDAVARLLNIEVWQRSEAVKRLAVAVKINYLQTPISKFGLFPPVELSLKLSCYTADLNNQIAKHQAKIRPVESVPELSLDDFEN